MVLSVINGVKEGGLRRRIERYAFYKGIVTLDLARYLHRSEAARDGRAALEEILICIDAKGMRALPADAEKVLSMICPIVLLPSSEAEAARMKETYAGVCTVADYPLSPRAFDEVLDRLTAPPRWERRTMYYGRLQIDRGARSVSYDGEKLDLKGYTYDILLILLENMGRVVSREHINHELPRRMRTSLRNVDTHIKDIRKAFDAADLIKCVRSVGYCIPADDFYRKVAETPRIS